MWSQLYLLACLPMSLGYRNMLTLHEKTAGIINTDWVGFADSLSMVCLNNYFKWVESKLKHGSQTICTICTSKHLLYTISFIGWMLGKFAMLSFKNSDIDVAWGAYIKGDSEEIICCSFFFFLLSIALRMQRIEE